jgi:hypothetical protein
MKYEKVLIPASLVAALVLAPVMALAVSTIVDADVKAKDSKIQAKIETATPIANDGTDGAFGYAVFTSGGDGSLIVTTTHATVCDSETQSKTSTLFFDSSCSPVWHTHYVNLAVHGGTDCAPNSALGGARLEVANLSYEQPGPTNTADTNVIFNNMPSSFTGTNAVTGTSLTWAPGSVPAGLVASFTLAVNNGHVCVENVSPAAAEVS